MAPLLPFFHSLLLAFSFLATTSFALKDTAPTVPNAFIAELAPDESAEAFYAKLGADGQAVKRRMDLTKYRLFNAVSFQLENVTDSVAAARKIENLQVVEKLWPVRVFSVPDDEVVWTANDGLTPLPDAGPRKRQDGGAVDTYSPHGKLQS